MSDMPLSQAAVADSRTTNQSSVHDSDGDETMAVATTSTATTTTVNFSSRSDSERPSGSRYQRRLRNLIPVRCEKPPPDVLPLDTNGFFSYMSFSWLSPTMWRIFRSGTTDGERHLALPTHEQADCSARRLESLWQEELTNQGADQASYGRVIYRAFRTRLVIGTFVNLLYAFLSLANPMVVIHLFLTYLTENDDVTLKTGIVYVILLGVIVLLRALTAGGFWMLNYEAAARIKYGSLALFYRKVVHLKSLGDKTVGDMVNFTSNDGQRIWDGITMCPFIIGGPMILVISCVYSIVYLGPWALIAWLVVIGFYPVMISFAKLSQSFRERCITVTDKRVGFMTELFTCIKMIKMYAWEELFCKKIAEVRGLEQDILEKSDFVMSLGMGLSMMVPLFASCLTFIGYVAAGNNLTPVKAFTFVSLLNAMQASLATIPFALKALSEMVVTANRMKELLLLEELKYYDKAPSQETSAVEIVDASFSWTSGRSTVQLVNGQSKHSPTRWKKRKKKMDISKTSLNEEEQEQMQTKTSEDEIKNQIFHGSSLHNITYTVKKGHLVGVCGHVGCGKSSLINAILGKMDLTSGSVAMSGQVAYVPQQPWIINDTVRGNILFGREFDSERYKTVLEACALTFDLNSFPARDATEVGERGVTLSGGQRQRVSLARAAYSQNDLLLLDDPLSAVDVQLGQHIFDRCVRGVLKGRTLVLVTHHLKYLEQCDDILVMKEGRVVQQGSHSQLIVQAGGEYTTLLSVFQKEMEKQVEKEGKITQKNGKEGQGGGGKGDEKSSLNKMDSHRHCSDVSLDNNNTRASIVPGEDKSLLEKGSVHTNEKLFLEEESGSGSLKLSVLHQYIQAMGGYVVMATVLLCFSLPVLGVATASWFLSYWLEQGGGGVNITVDNHTVTSQRVLDHPEKDTYLLIYAMFIPILIITMVLRSYSLVKTSIKASGALHYQGFKQILKCSMSFFDATPVGRIVNRFSSDMDEIDVRLPMNVEILINNILQVFAALAIITYVLPWFLVTVVPLGAFFLFLMMVFHTCVRELKRWDNVSRSPILSHMAMSVQGLASIQAYRRKEDFIRSHCKLLNSNCVAVFLFYSANRWLAIRLDIVSAAITSITGLLILMTFDLMNPAMAGLALAYSVQMSGLFQFLARLAVETEARFTSVERLLQYCNMEEGEKMTVKPQVLADKGWPKSGGLTFDNVRLRYRSGLPLALKDVSFRLEPRQRIGVVGRTGAGKSSLTTALFRLVELESGTITIDGVDIARVSLQELRSKVSIIPQDPVLFSGTIRYNLDPFSQFSDSDIWLALEKCHTGQMVKSLDHQLSTQVLENGENFSVGERQLLCLARALLRGCKILVLDEATAAIDPETDRAIRETLTEAFPSCSMLIIAHRLESVLACDQILLMEHGQVQEFDIPANLLSDSKSKFKTMLDASSGIGPGL